MRTRNKISDKERLDWLQYKAPGSVRDKIASEICAVTRDHHCRCDWSGIRGLIDAAIRAERKARGKG